jgi:hypothetical protein
LENSDANIVGIVVGRDKLVYFRDPEVFMRFDLVADPGEITNRFDPEAPLDRRLLSRMARHRPDLFKDELSKPSTRALYMKRLREFDGRSAKGALDFLIRLAPYGDADAAYRALERLHRKSEVAWIRQVTGRALRQKGAASR